ncbi:hypothetical protein D3C87_1551410 [compost metagenome]
MGCRYINIIMVVIFNLIKREHIKLKQQYIILAHLGVTLDRKSLQILKLLHYQKVIFYLVHYRAAWVQLLHSQIGVYQTGKI